MNSSPTPIVPAAEQMNQKPYEKQIPETNNTAIEGLVAGVVGLFFLHLILGIVAVILSAVAMPQIERKGQKGKGLAIAGLVLGILDVVYFIGKVLYLMNN
jgi:heme/copper-type cytochrome/quinol oxidase subunit 3